MCEDFKQTVSRASKLDCYPIPKIDDLLATLKGGKFLFKLYLYQAYEQLWLDPESQKYVNTHRGLFRYTQMPFGTASATGIFQWVMESILLGIPGVICVCGQNTNLREFQARECGRAAGSALSVVGSQSKVEEGEKHQKWPRIFQKWS